MVPGVEMEERDRVRGRRMEEPRDTLRNTTQTIGNLGGQNERGKTGARK